MFVANESSYRWLHTNYRVTLPATNPVSGGYFKISTYLILFSHTYFLVFPSLVQYFFNGKTSHAILPFSLLLGDKYLCHRFFLEFFYSPSIGLNEHILCVATLLFPNVFRRSYFLFSLTFPTCYWNVFYGLLFRFYFTENDLCVMSIFQIFSEKIFFQWTWHRHSKLIFTHS